MTIPASIGAFFLSRAASGSSSMCPEFVTARVTPANRFFMAKPESISARHVVFTEQASTPPSSSNTWTPEKKEFWTERCLSLYMKWYHEKSNSQVKAALLISYLCAALFSDGGMTWPSPQRFLALKLPDSCPRHPTGQTLGREKRQPWHCSTSPCGA